MDIDSLSDGFDPTGPGPDVVDPTDDDLGGQAISMDTDGDGYAETTIIDSDGDGLADTMIFEDVESGVVAMTMDLDGDGTADTYIETTLDPDSLDLVDGDLSSDDVDSVDDGDVAYVDDPPFDDTDDVSDPNIHGDPQGEMEYHQTQGADNTCLPTSIAMVVTEITGEPVDQADVAQMAEDNGFMMESGMQMENGVTLLNELGVDAELRSGTLDELRTALDNGDDIIIGLDAADLYSGDGGPFDQGMLSGHAVVITGIDDEAGMVYINDPAFPDGAGVEIPIATFEDAWEDSGNALIAVDDPDVDSSADADADVESDTGTGTGSGSDDAWLDDLRTIILPMVFKVEA